MRTSLPSPTRIRITFSELPILFLPLSPPHTHPPPHPPPHAPYLEVFVSKDSAEYTMICSAVSAKLRFVYSCLNTSNYLVDAFDLSSLFWRGGMGIAVATENLLPLMGQSQGQQHTGRQYVGRPFPKRLAYFHKRSFQKSAFDNGRGCGSWPWPWLFLGSVRKCCYKKCWILKTSW